MKNSRLLIFILLTSVLIGAMFISCDKNEQIPNELKSVDFSSKGFVGTKVAYKGDNSVKLAISNDELISSFTAYSSKYDLDKKGKSFDILEIEGKYYIRFTNTDDSISTVALLNDSSKFKKEKNKIGNFNLMYIGETVCTTEACAACSGCIPDGNYCSNGTLDARNCTRTTSGG